jgi:Meckel syndrome type 1 protein
MSTEPDRDPALAALWREHSTETPSPRVDAAILAAAHSAVADAQHGRERSPGQRAWRWWVPLAAAAVVAVVVVGVKPPSQTIVDDAAQSASDRPAASAEKQSATPTPAAPPAAPPVAPLAMTSPRTEAAQPSIAPPPQVAPAAPDTSASRGRGKVDAERVQAFAAPPPARAAASIAAPAQPASPAGAAAGGSNSAAAESTAPAARADQATALSTDDWIARIRTLRERGAQDEALRELARFRAVYPDADARLPADLREWAKRMPR